MEPDQSLADGVRAAFLAEAATAARYTYFARVADIEGHTEAARVFDELAESVACAAHGHLDVLRDLLGGDDPDTGRALGDSAAISPRRSAATSGRPPNATPAWRRGRTWTGWPIWRAGWRRCAR